MSNSSSPSIPANVKERNKARAVSGARQANIETAHSSGASESSRTGRSSTDSSNSSSTASRIHDCSETLRVRNTSAQTVPSSRRISAPAVAPAGSDVVDVDPAGVVVRVEVVVEAAVVVVVATDAAVPVSAAVEEVSATTVVGAGLSPPQADSPTATARAPRTASRRTRITDIPITPSAASREAQTPRLRRKPPLRPLRA